MRALLSFLSCFCFINSSMAGLEAFTASANAPEDHALSFGPDEDDVLALAGSKAGYCSVNPNGPPDKESAKNCPRFKRSYCNTNGTYNCLWIE